MNCNLTVTDVIKKYMDLGWIEMSELFTNSEVAKEKELVDAVNEKLLSMLGCIRTYTVDQIFLCALKTLHINRKQIDYTAFGSSNLTSDYDITITGKKAPEVMWSMFDKFLKKYKNLLPTAFDTNIYCAGMYSNTLYNSRINQIYNVKNSQFFILKSSDEQDNKIQLKFALLSLLESGINMHQMETNINIYNFISSVSSIQKQIKAELETQLNIVKKQFPSYNKETLIIIARYKLNYMYAKKLFAILYGKQKDNKDVINLACLTQYFSIESYYSPSTFNTVVMHLQAGYKIRLTKKDHICSIIENLANFRKHCVVHKTKQYSTKYAKMVLLKNSKYLYRMYYSLSKITKKENVATFIKILEKDVIPNRSSIDKKIVNKVMKQLQFPKKSSERLKDFVETQTIFILNEIDPLI